MFCIIFLLHFSLSDINQHCWKCNEVKTETLKMEDQAVPSTASHLQSDILGKPLAEWSCKCDICDIRFSKDSKLKLHMITVHDEVKPFVCPHCPYKARLKRNLQIHIRVNSIRRCFTNLIDNGLSYGKKVQIITKKKTRDLIIFIDDDGPGIPEEEYQNVMKPFYRIDKSRGQNKSGVGLGLSISNDIIRAHGGNINLEKSSLGGLRVKISLPL